MVLCGMSSILTKKREDGHKEGEGGCKICGFGQIWEHYVEREGKDVFARDVVLGGNSPCHCFFLLKGSTAVQNFDKVFMKRE